MTRNARRYPTRGTLSVWRGGLLLIFIAAISLAACSRAKDSVIPTDAQQWDRLGESVKSLDERDKQLLLSYLMRMKMAQILGGGAGIPAGTTVGQAIEDQQKWLDEQAIKEARQKVLRDQLEARRAAMIQAMQKTVTIAFLDEKIIPKDFDAGRYRPYFEMRIGVRNTGTKSIKGVKARLTILNTFGDIVYTSRLRIEEQVAAGKAITWIGGHELNEFIDRDKALINLEPGTFKVTVEPIMIVYDDGSKVEAPEN